MYTREGQSTLARPESAIVRYEWLSRWTFPYPSRYILSAHCGLPDISMFVLETPIEYHRIVFDFSMSVGGVPIRNRAGFFALRKNRIVPFQFSPRLSHFFLFFLSSPRSDSRNGSNVYIYIGRREIDIGRYYNLSKYFGKREKERRKNVRQFDTIITQVSSIPAWLPRLAAKSCSKFPLHPHYGIQPANNDLFADRKKLGKISHVQRR